MDTIKIKTEKNVGNGMMRGTVFPTDPVVGADTI